VAAHELAVKDNDTRLPARSADSLDDSARFTQLTSHDLAMGWILVAMIAFGVAVGFVFPTVVAPLIDLRPSGEAEFRIACVVAGFCVGGFAYGVARFTLFRANRRLASPLAADSSAALLSCARRAPPVAWAGRACAPA